MHKSILFSVVAVSLSWSCLAEEKSSSTGKRIEHVEVGDHCDLASAPDSHHGGSWHVVEEDVEKVCAPGSSCRNGACNCDDLADGTLMGISQDQNGFRVCRRVAGQKCSADAECFQRVQCLEGICTCPQDAHCQTSKNEVYILD